VAVSDKRLLVKVFGWRRFGWWCASGRNNGCQVSVADGDVTSRRVHTTLPLTGARVTGDGTGSV